MIGRDTAYTEKIFSKTVTTPHTQDVQKSMAPACGVPDPYQVLGVCETAPTEEIIREAWRKKALEAHPDKGGSEQAFNEVQAAYEWLKAHISAHLHDHQKKPKATSFSGGQARVDPWQNRAPHSPEEPFIPTASTAAPSTKLTYYSTRTRWHMVFHCDKTCHGLKKASKPGQTLFEDADRPKGLEPCPTCVPKRWAKR